MARPPASGAAEEAEERAEGSRRDWSSLPDLALFSIAMDLSSGSLADVLAFGRVCREWRSVARDNDGALMCSLPPMLFRTATADFHCPADGRLYRNRRLVESLTTPVGLLPVSGCSFGHLIVRNLADDAKTTTGAFFILNPLTGACAGKFPANSLDPLSWAAISAHPSSPDCTLWISDGRLVRFCHAGDREWATLKFPTDYFTSPPAFHRNVNYIGVSTIKTPESRLCMSDGALQQVRSQRGETSLRVNRFHVIRLDINKKRLATVRGVRVWQPLWDPAVDRSASLDSLGDRALFWDGYGVTVSNNPGRWGGSRNCIYFVNEEDGKLGVFHFKDAKFECLTRVSPAANPPELRRLRPRECAWIHPSLCY